MVALVTPMQSDGGIDYEALAKLVVYHIENNTDAIIAVGTTGESPTLNTKEHCEVIRRVVDAAAGRIPIIAGTGSNSTKEAIELTQCAMEVGADACLLVTPYYNKPTQEGLYRHFKSVAEAVPIPQILYNVPARTSCDMSVDTIDRLAQISNIVGIKEATGDMQKAKEIVSRCGDKINLYSGDDMTAVELILLGGKGNISVTANVVPGAMHKMCVAAALGDRPEAMRIHNAMMDLHRALFVESNPIPVKWALVEIGLISAGIRLPLTPLSESYHTQVRQAIKNANNYAKIN